ncbi:hypothetical protein BDZ85DRAFT_58341 [Elsinoe ampelina]|uniref:Uncharacterized protein n=1 Tax=Elsinoe ampelina TaxID=302913 RepID=A0A6A6GN45_9PEZI|nr:hypothetical protein BDZ85DRAFT_58341 [Elsinoe ampelina]
MCRRLWLLCLCSRQAIYIHRFCKNKECYRGTHRPTYSPLQPETWLCQVCETEDFDEARATGADSPTEESPAMPANDPISKLLEVMKRRIYCQKDALAVLTHEVDIDALDDRGLRGVLTWFDLIYHERRQEFRGFSVPPTWAQVTKLSSTQLEDLTLAGQAEGTSLPLSGAGPRTSTSLNEKPCSNLSDAENSDSDEEHYI